MQYRNIDKQALKENGYTVLSKITIVGTNTVFTEDDHIVNWDYEDYRYVPDNGFIGQFVERILDGNLQDISENIVLEDTEINLQLGIVNALDNNRTTWYNYGNFLVTKVEKTDTTGNYRFESADYTKKFNIPFKIFYEREQDGETEFREILFPCLASELADYTCAQAGLELDGYDANNECWYHIINNEDGLDEGNYHFTFNDGRIKYVKFTLDDYLSKYSVIEYFPKKNKMIIKKVNFLRNNNGVVYKYEIPYTISTTKDNYTALVYKKINLYDFENNDFVIEGNQYNSDETCRKVMQDISKLAYSWVRIGEDNKVHIDFTPRTTSSVDQYDQLTTDEYYVSKKSDLAFGPVNKVLIGMSDVEGENMYETSPDYTEETECAIKIYDNNLTNTDELRAIALNGCDRLFGLTYTPIEINSVGHPWLDGDELIKLTNVDDEVIYTYPFNRKITYAGYIEGTIGAEAHTAQESKYEYKSDIISNVKKTAFIVDKQAQVITATVEKVDEDSDKISQLRIDVNGIEARVSGIETTEVVAVTNEYAVNSSATTPPEQSSSSWSETKPTRGEGQYIWARIKTTYKDESVEYSDPVNTTGDKGDSGKGISTVTYYYKATNTQTQPSADSITSTTIPTLDGVTNKYLWRKEVTTYTNGTSNTIVSLSGVHGSNGEDGNGIQSITYYYKATNTQTEPSAASITSTSIPTLDATTNKYLWQKEVIKYTDTSIADKVSVSLIGVHGGDGDNGASIDTVTQYYAVSDDNETPPSVWTTDLSSIELTPTNKYLWNYERITYTEGKEATETGERVIGVYGDSADPAIMYHNAKGTEISTTDAGDIELKSVNSIEGQTEQETIILPEEYTQVEYIQSTDTLHNRNYIDLNFIPNNNTSLEITFAYYDDTGVDYSRLYGSSNLFRTQAGGSGLSTQFWWNNANQINLSFSVNTIYTIKQEKNKLYLDGELKKESTNSTWEDTYSMRLFSATTGDRDSKIKVYHAKLWDGEELIRDLIPCYRISDNEIGLYDLVNNVFYTNQGTGTFAKGSNVTLPTPDFPQDIHVVSGDNEINICGKNLFNSSIASLNSSYTIPITTGAFGNLNAYTMQLEPNTQYTLTLDMNGTSVVGTWVFAVVNGDFSQIKQLQFNGTTSGSVTFTTTSSGIIYVGQKYGSQDRLDTYFEKAKIQIEKGSTATTYEPYIGNTYPIYLGVENLFTTTLEQNARNNTDGTTTIWSAKYIRTKDKIKVEPNTTYYINYEGSFSGGDIQFYQADSTYLNNIALGNTPKSFTTPNNAYYINIQWFRSSGIEPTDITNLQLTKGSTPQYISSTPIELCKIGTYKDSIYKGEGTNLFDVNVIQERTIQGITMSFNGQTIHLQGTATGNANFYMKSGSSFTLEAGTYFITRSSMSGIATLKLTSGSTTIVATGSTDVSFTLSDTTIIDGLTMQVPSSVGTINKDVIVSIVKGNQALPYEPYNAKDKWLLHKEIGKVVLNGSESWGNDGGGAPYRYSMSDIKNPPNNQVAEVFCNFYTSVSYGDNWNNYDYLITRPPYNTASKGIKFKNKDISSLNDFKTWLSTHNTIVYYVLNTPTTIEITNDNYPELLSQLNAFEKAKTFEGTNNISVHGNLPIILDIDYWTYYKGETGRSIQNIMDEYALSTSSTEITGEWSTSVPTMTETNRYLWNRETITYSNPTSTQVGEPKIIGVYGLTGDTGKGIQSVTELYYVSSSNTTPAKPTSHVTTSSVTAYNTWNLQCSPYTTTYKYFYTCSEILYTDNTYGWTNVVQNQGLALANQNATNAMNKINNMKIGGRNLITESTYIKAPSETANWTAGLGNTITASYTDEGRIGTVPSTSFGEIQLFTTLEQINCKQTDEITFSCDVKLLPLDDESKPDVSNYVYLGYSLYYDGTTYSPNWYTGAQLQWVASTAGAKYDEWTRLNIVFPGYTGTVEYQRMMFGVIAKANQANSDIRFIVRNCKIEKGNQATDWTMAQEEIQDEFADVNSTFTKYVTKESYDSDWATYENEILGKVAKTYVTESDYTKFTEKAEAQFKLIPTGAQITASATQVFEDGIKGISETVDNIDETFTFTTNGLKIARSGNTMSLLLANDRLSFMNGEVEKAYMTSDAFVLEQLREFRLGNFAFKVRTNGSIDFLKVK